MAKKQTERVQEPEPAVTVETPVGPQPPILNDEQLEEINSRPANYEPPRDMIVSRLKVKRVLVYWDGDQPLQLTTSCTLKPNSQASISEDDFRRLGNLVKHVVLLPKGLVPGDVHLATNKFAAA